MNAKGNKKDSWAIYVGTDLQLYKQKEAGESYATERQLKVIARFNSIDDGRTGFKRMLKLVKENKSKIAYVLVTNLDRFKRSGEHTFAIFDDLTREYGVEIVALKPSLHLETELWITKYPRYASVKKKKITRLKFKRRWETAVIEIQKLSTYSYTCVKTFLISNSGSNLKFY